MKILTALFLLTTLLFIGCDQNTITGTKDVVSNDNTIQSTNPFYKDSVVSIDTTSFDPQGAVLFVETEPIMLDTTFRLYMAYYIRDNSWLRGYGFEFTGCSNLGDSDEQKEGNWVLVSQLFGSPPDSFITNQAMGHLRLSDTTYVVTKRFETATHFDPVLNTPPHDVQILFFPNRVSANETAELLLEGYDDENNMINDIKAEIIAGPDMEGFNFIYGQHGVPFAMNTEAHVFQYRIHMEVPDTEGDYTVLCTVKDDEGNAYIFTKEFIVEKYNRVPVITAFYADKKEVVVGEQVTFTVKAVDPDGDKVYFDWGLTNTIGNAYSDYTSNGDTTIMVGYFHPGGGISRIQVQATDKALYSPQQEMFIIANDDMSPKVTDYWITLPGQERQSYSVSSNSYLNVSRGDTVTFEIAVDNPAGGPLQYKWHTWTYEEQLDGWNQNIISGIWTKKIVFVMPDVSRSLHMECTVWDENNVPANHYPTIFTVQ